MLLQIGDFDATPLILEGGYQMQQDDVFKKWTDGNGKNHRIIYNTRITGSVKLKPKTVAQYTALVTALKESKSTDGLYPITAFVNNLNSAEIFNAYISGDFVMSKNTGGRKWWDQIDLGIEEE